MPIDIPFPVIQAGGWVFASAVLAGVLFAVIRGDLVPGRIYRREVKRADTATAQLERSNDISETLTVQVKTLAELVADVLRPRGR